ncbi:GNAT family N-acetyltransferase [Lewinella cohaerens]|uniref:GNAT family N-acetyltransferase n=1 Tax=Lewinella cohaerens TaxID=70995 RepID=UPI0003683175|nr:GNAT family N-acetyltransferase [Lewinella cohaerens]
MYTIRTFRKEDFLAYQTWFTDPAIQRALGHVDEEWLAYVLADETGAEYVMLREDQLMGVAGVSFANEQNPFYVITNLAINPAYAGRGIGSLFLEKITARVPLEQHQYWATFVEIFNEPAQRFFTKNNWEQTLHEDGMIRYEKRL